MTIEALMDKVALEYKVRDSETGQEIVCKTAEDIGIARSILEGLSKKRELNVLKNVVKKPVDELVVISAEKYVASKSVSRFVKILNEFKLATVVPKEQVSTVGTVEKD